MSVRRQRNRAQNVVEWQSIGRQMAVKRQSIGAYAAANVRQTTAKSRSKRRQTAVNRQANGSQSALTGVQMSVRRQRNRTQNAVKRQSVGRQTAVNRRLRGCKCQSDDSEIALKTPPNGSQSAVKRQSIGAYGAANVSQMTAKSRSKRRQMAVSRQSIGAYGGANVSQTAAKSHSSRKNHLPLHCYAETKELARTTVHRNGATSINVTTIVWGLMLDSNAGLINGILAQLGIAKQPFLTAPSHALWSIIILATWKGVPLWALFFLAGLQGIPESVVEAAKIDGAKPLEHFYPDHSAPPPRRDALRLGRRYRREFPLDCARPAFDARRSPTVDESDHVRNLPPRLCL